MATGIQLLNKALQVLEEISQFKVLRADLKKKAMKTGEEIKQFVSTSEVSSVVNVEENVRSTSNLTVPVQSGRNYSEALRGHIRVSQNSPAQKLIITSDTLTHPTKMMLEFKKCIKPKALQVGIKKLATTRKGSIYLETQDFEDREKIIDELRKCTDFKAKKLTKRNPRIIIKDIDQEVSLANIADTLQYQNPRLNLNKENIKPIIILENRKKTRRHAVLEVEKETRKVLMSNPVRLEYEMHHPEDYHVVRRCTKCYKYHHKSGDCRGQTVCPICAGGHPKSECTSEDQKCINCITYNRYHQDSIQLPTDHTAFHTHCPSYIKELRKLINNTDY